MNDKHQQSRLSLVDTIGVLFVSDNKVLRAINQASVDETRELLDSGLLNELMDQELFPATAISDNAYAGYPLVLEHEKIDPVIYPFEWSPEMLRRAAICVLEVNECANKYGYELKDAHPYNVVFKYDRAVFVDFGSFVKQKTSAGWLAYDEFISSHYRVLRLCKKGLFDVFRHVFLIKGGIKGSEIAVITNRIYSLLGMGITDKFFKYISAYRRGPAIGNDIIDRQFRHPAANALAKFILKSPWLPFRKFDSKSWMEKIRSIRLDGKTAWGDYHNRSGFYSADGSVHLTPRLVWVRDVVAELKPCTIIELGGNQGVLSRTLSKLPGVKRVICADYDTKSIDSLMLRVKADEKVFMACFDFMAVDSQTSTNVRATRFFSDMVIALAVTHHLILTQKYSIDAIFRTLSDYTKKYLIVEFMPLGLWDGNTAPPLPDWYNEPWFVENLCKYFEIRQRVELERNRIVFVAEIINKRIATP